MTFLQNGFKLSLKIEDNLTITGCFTIPLLSNKSIIGVTRCLEMSNSL